MAALVGAAVLVAGRAAGGPPGTTSPASPPVERYVVRSGDTLWEIARTRVGAAADPRPFIEEIRDLSGLATSSLRAGQVLLVPAA